MSMLFATAWLALRRIDRSGDADPSTHHQADTGRSTTRAQARAGRVVEAE